MFGKTKLEKGMLVYNPYRKIRFTITEMGGELCAGYPDWGPEERIICRKRDVYRVKQPIQQPVILDEPVPEDLTLNAVIDRWNAVPTPITTTPTYNYTWVTPNAYTATTAVSYDVSNPSS